MNERFGVVGAVVAALAAAIAARAEVRLWTAELPASEAEVPAEERTLRPVHIVAARQGAFSGKVVLESEAPIAGVQAKLGPISGPSGVWPTDSLRVRYATLFEEGARGPTAPDTLLEAPPATMRAIRGRYLLPIWITARVPLSARAGAYTGEVNVRAKGLSPARVPVTIEVADFTLPPSEEYRTWCDVVQSPDTLALEYGVPLWSERHWELIARSFREIAGTGSRVLYLPLICRTNLGNEESLVRWIRRGDRYEFDFRVFDRYLDTAEKNLGRPKMTVLWAWDICMSQRALQRGLWKDEQGGQRTRENREELLGKGPRVTRLDPATGKTEVLTLPRYAESAGRSAWRPLWAELRRRLARRGLEGTLLLGMVSDLQPDKDDAEALKDLSGDLPWAAQCHPALLRDKPPRNNRIVQGVADVGYVAHVYAVSFQVNPALGRLYGWQSPVHTAHYYRGYELLGAPLEVRLHPEFALTGGQRGVGRIPAEFWPVLRDAQGRRRGRVAERYPENLWRNLDICTWFLAPGPDGPVATVRFEHLREGIQECEARILIEAALLDRSKRTRLGEDLARRAQEMLDERHRAMWRTVWANEEDFAKIGNVDTGRNPEEALWHAMMKQQPSLPSFFDAEARRLQAESQRKGRAWWLQQWRERNLQLFATAGEVQRRAGR